MSVAPTKLLTAEELLAMPGDGFHRYELVRGELIEMSPSGIRHGRVAALLHHHLSTHVLLHKLGETYIADVGFRITQDPDSVLAPDVSFVREERVIDIETFYPGPPDLAVEVISPNDRYSEVHAKVFEYLRAGTSMVILVDPNKQTAQIRTATITADLTIDDSLDGADVVPGWTLPLRELFQS